MVYCNMCDLGLNECLSDLVQFVGVNNGGDEFHVVSLDFECSCLVWVEYVVVVFIVEVVIYFGEFVWFFQL